MRGTTVDNGDFMLIRHSGTILTGILVVDGVSSGYPKHPIEHPWVNENDASELWGGLASNICSLGLSIGNLFDSAVVNFALGLTDSIALYIIYMYSNAYSWII